MNNLDKQYEDYIDEFGGNGCVYIPRKQGSDTSLLSEIVYRTHGLELFPREQDAMRKRSSAILPRYDEKGRVIK